MTEFSKSILGSLRRIIFGRCVLLPLADFFFSTGAKIDRDPMVLTCVCIFVRTFSRKQAKKPILCENEGNKASDEQFSLQGANYGCCGDIVPRF